jgi:hypothetical protein
MGGCYFHTTTTRGDPCAAILLIARGDQQEWREWQQSAVSSEETHPTSRLLLEGW